MRTVGLRQRRYKLSASASPIPYTGNKSCIVKTILDVMPPHETYIEPCMGSAEVFFRKLPADREIINDYNGDLVNLFRVLQDNQNLDKVIGRLYLSLNAELLFRQNKELLTNSSVQICRPVCLLIKAVGLPQITHSPISASAIGLFSKLAAITSSRILFFSASLIWSRMPNSLGRSSALLLIFSRKQICESFSLYFLCHIIVGWNFLQSGHHMPSSIILIIACFCHLGSSSQLSPYNYAIVRSSCPRHLWRKQRVILSSIIFSDLQKNKGHRQYRKCRRPRANLYYVNHTAWHFAELYSSAAGPFRPKIAISFSRLTYCQRIKPNWSETMLFVNRKSSQTIEVAGFLLISFSRARHILSARNW